MFNVVHRITGKVYTVYGVKNEGNIFSMIYFLIFDDEWKWTHSANYIPAVE